MKLKNHREDVRYLKRLAENRLSLAPIAKRYLNLIRMAEDWLSALHSESLLTKRDKRVLKDSEYV